MKSQPNRRLGWYNHYVWRFNKFGSPDAAAMAMWLLFLMFDDGEINV